LLILIVIDDDHFFPFHRKWFSVFEVKIANNEKLFWSKIIKKCPIIKITFENFSDNNFFLIALFFAIFVFVQK